MKFQDVDIFGTLNMTGSFQIPYGYGTGSYPQTPLSGSLFLNTETNTVVVANTNGWETVGAQVTPPPPPYDIEYLSIAGGAAGGGWGGGGGAGGYLSSSISSVSPGTEFTLTIGGGAAGGALSTGGYVQGGDGTDTTIESSTITTIT